MLNDLYIAVNTGTTDNPVIVTYTVYDPPTRDPSVNWFKTTTGASNYGHGEFLISETDYRAIVGTANDDNGSGGSPGTSSDGTCTVIMTSNQISSGFLASGSTPGGGGLPVLIVGAVQYGIAVNNINVVRLRVVDMRFQLWNSTNDSFVYGVQPYGFPYFNGNPLGGNVGVGSITWMQLCADLQDICSGTLNVTGFPQTGPLVAPTTWNPRNINWPGSSFGEVLDGIANMLWWIVAFDYSASTGAGVRTGSMFYDTPGGGSGAGEVPGYNAALLAQAMSGTSSQPPALVGGDPAFRQEFRLPSSIDVIFSGLYSKGQGRRY